MYLSTVALLALSQILSVRASSTPGFDVLVSPANGSSFAVGSVLPIVWQPGTSSGTVSIILNGGATPDTMDHIMTIGKSISSQAGGYNWTITSGVGSFATYGLNLTLDETPITKSQESFPFHITGGGDTSSNTTSTTSSGGVVSTSTSATSSASGTGTVSTSSASGTTLTVVKTTPSGTVPSTTSTEKTSTSSVSTSATGSATKTSSGATTSNTSTTSGASAKVVSGSLTMLSAFIFAFAL